MRARGIQILHAVGRKNLVTDHEASTSTDRAPYVVLPYIERMDLAYAAADLALCRAGAVTCAELSAVGLPAVFVPLPIGNGEQQRNAEPVVEGGGGLLVQDGALTGDYLLDAVVALLLDDEKLAAMSTATARFGHRDAATRMAELIMSAARGADRAQ